MIGFDSVVSFAATGDTSGLNWENIIRIFSPYLIAFLSAYILTVVIKNIILSLTKRKSHWRDGFKSGGMPSSHSAEVMALATVVGLIDGFGSALFGIAACLAAIVMYDAFHVRRAVGEQGKVIEELIVKAGVKVEKPYFTRGHRLIEVFVGALIGVMVGAIVALTFN